MLPPHIHSASDLITPRDAIREGFINQALAKIEKAEPHIVRAREFRAALDAVLDINQIVGGIPESIREALLSAAGLSRKALNRLPTDADRQRVLSAVLQRIAESAGDAWREELVYRFLLTKGDALGGTMRNYIGAIGGVRLSRGILEALERTGLGPNVRYSRTKPDKIVTIAWGQRVLVFDRKVGQNNVDAILLDAASTADEKRLIADPSTHLAYGELKGGIDPAGADEHWKTAGSAIERLRGRAKLADQSPKLFIVAAAVETEMARQIFDDLYESRLDHAANLTVPQQVADLADWLIRL